MVEESPRRTRRALNRCCRNLTDHPAFTRSPSRTPIHRPPNERPSTTPITTTTLNSPAIITPPSPYPTLQNPTRQRFSHGRKQRRRRAQAKAQQTSFANQILTERTHLHTQLHNAINTSTIRVQQHFPTLPLPTQTNHLNARHILANTHPAAYFPPVTKLAFHDLTSTHKLPPTAHHILGLGLKFIPTPNTNFTPNDLETCTTRFERDINLRVFFAGDDLTPYDPNALRVKSTWRAPLPPRNIDERIGTFITRLTDTFQQSNTTSNISSHQRNLLRQIKTNKLITILSADKGLGPVGIDTKQYIEWGLRHLTDSTTYTILSETTARLAATQLYHTIHDWTLRHHKTIGSDNVKYIRRHTEKAQADPFGYFYLLAKLHKTPTSTRPVCSDCASLPHSIGKWVDRQLQPIVQAQTYYFKNSFDLKQLLDPMTLPPNACLFTYDAVSMYTNIDTHQCLQRLTTFLTDPTTSTNFPHLSPVPLIEALNIIMHNNRMTFGDIFVHQHKGIAMGMSPAPSIANLFVAIYEETYIKPFPLTVLPFLKRFIDDGFGIWIKNPNPTIDTQNWENFQTLINGMGLTWEFSQRSNEVVFMDLTISLTNGRIATKLFAKPMALHLYIPPFSCHAPGVATGLIHGHFYRVIMLCTHQHDITRELSTFFTRLLDRGYTPEYLLPIFLSAEKKAYSHRHLRLQQLTHPAATLPRPSQQNTNDSTFLHLQYHPANPPSSTIQDIWRKTVLTPLMKPPLYHLRNRDGHLIDIKRLTIAYSRAPNLGNILSCRILRAKIRDYTDKQHHPSLFMDEDEDMTNPHTPPTQTLNITTTTTL